MFKVGWIILEAIHMGTYLHSNEEINTTTYKQRPKKQIYIQGQNRFCQLMRTIPYTNQIIGLKIECLDFCQCHSHAQEWLKVTEVESNFSKYYWNNTEHSGYMS